MPALSGVYADRVRRVPLLQGHEEVRWTGTDEAVVSAPAVHCGESLKLNQSLSLHHIQLYLLYTTTQAFLGLYDFRDAEIAESSTFIV